jgi:group I intron endonuclease
MIIYMAHCPSTNSFYYGKTVKSLEKRKRQHLIAAEANKNGSLFHKALRKHGHEAFNWYVLESCVSKELLSERERFWIALGRRIGQRLYNLSDGGDGGGRTGSHGKPLTKETKEKISHSLREYYKYNKGTMTGRVGKSSPMWGKTVSQDVRKRISESHKLIRKPHMIGSKNHSARRVICLTTGEVFQLASIAANKYDTDLSSIIKCCRGKVKSAMGRMYAYHDKTYLD